jgi:hypothetical protein
MRRGVRNARHAKKDRDDEATELELSQRARAKFIQSSLHPPELSTRAYDRPIDALTLPISPARMSNLGGAGLGQKVQKPNPYVVCLARLSHRN